MKKTSRRSGRPSANNAAFSCCPICRNRRIRCDGKRPSCNNCLVRGYGCPGYSSWDLWLAPTSASPHTPLPLETSQRLEIDAPMSSPLSNAHIITDELRHAFDYFRFHLCAKFLERRYPISWATSSISIALQEPAVFYAIAALSITEQAASHTIHNSLARPIDASRRDVAVRMYSKAISCLREPMQRAIGGIGSLEPIILSCVLFLVYEVYTGNSLNAMRHARVGKAILDERLGQSLRRSTSMSTRSSSNQSFQRAGEVFLDLGFDSAPADVFAISFNIHSGSCFQSMDEARSCLETLIEAAHDIGERLMNRAREVTRNLTSIKSKDSRTCLEYTFSRFVPIDLSLQGQLSGLMDEFATWRAKFGPMFASGDFISQDLFFLQIRFFNASFTLALCRANTERLTDHFADQFARTVNSAERLLRHRPPTSQELDEETTTGPVAIEFMQKLRTADSDCSARMEEEESRAQLETEYLAPPQEADSHAAGVFEFGILAALFAIACKCRTSSIRCRAAELLANIKRWEAITSSETLSMYAQAIIDLEEQQASRLLDQSRVEFYADEVPDEARFLDIVASPMVEGSGYFTLSCTRRMSGGNNIQVLEYECNRLSGEYRLANESVIRVDDRLE